jgi:hypothetical protein
LCQENTSVELALLVTAIEEIVQGLVKELIKTKRKYDAAASDAGDQSRDSISTTSTNISADPPAGRKGKHSSFGVPTKRPPHLMDGPFGTRLQKLTRCTTAS